MAKYSRQRPPKCIAFIRQNVTKTKTMRYYILISLLFSMMLASLCLRKSDECPEPLITEVAQDYHTDIRCEALTLDNVYTYLCDLDVKFPDIVTRQCILETGWLTSYNCLERNNLFGMTGGEKTPENPNGYAIYKAWKHSCRAYLRWQRRRYSDGDYYDFLECVGYAESPTYVDKLKSIKIVFYK